MKGTHGAWLHGWIMEMENREKLEHLKVEDIDTEPFLFRKRKQGWQTTMKGLRQGQLAKNWTNTRASSGNGLRFRNKAAMQL